MQQVRSNARMMHLPAHQRVLLPGTRPEGYLLVAAGSLRVQILTENGREVKLYQVGPGDTCVLTTSCLLSGDHFPAEGITDTDVTVFMLSAQQFNHVLEHSPPFRRFVLAKFGQRLAEVISRIEQLCSVSIDRSLANTLLKLNTSDAPIKTTHQELAAELGTAREVVSRHLKHFESQGWVSLGRGNIDIVEPAKLAWLAEHTPPGRAVMSR